MWSSFFGALAGSGAIGVLLKWYLDTRTEWYKSELQRILFEHEITYRYFHEHRVECISTIYSLFVETHQLYQTFFSVTGDVNYIPKQEEYRIARNKAQELTINYRNSRLYLEKDICTKIDSILEEITNSTFGLDLLYNDDFEDYGPPIQGIILGRWHIALNKFEKEIPLILNEIEDEFRNIINPPKTVEQS